MSTTRENSGHDPLKSIRPADNKPLTSPLTATVSIVLILSTPFVLYSIFYPGNPPEFFHWPGLKHPTLYPTHLETDVSPTNISHIAFGIGGSTHTWAHRSKYSDIWWKPGSTRGFVFLDAKPDPNARFKIQHRVSSDWTRFKHSATRSDSAVRIARVVKDLFRVGLPNVRWFVMGDDDTVFFAENLATVLGKYDHRGMVYVGGNSESVEQDVMHSYDMAFGGGGFAISYPLAAELWKKMDGCLDRYHYFYGSDQRVWACIGELGVSLSKEPGFHQIDIRGDPYGLLAAHPLAPLVSLHHLDHVEPLFPGQTQLQSLNTLMKAYELDPSRTLQQCYCYNHKFKWSISVSWGYTVQLYPTIVAAKDLEMPLSTFKTFRSWSDGPFTFNTRPLSHNPCEQPVIFYLDSVEEVNGNETVTTYKKFTADGEKNCNRHYAHAMAIQSVSVTAPKMDPHEWQKVPRRHCCEMSRTMAHRTVRIRIRKCKRSESALYEGSI